MSNESRFVISFVSDELDKTQNHALAEFLLTVMNEEGG